jgi:hypothetical protein
MRSTVPATSWPRVLPMRGLSSPMLMIAMSEWQSPAPPTFSSTSSGAISGTGLSQISTVSFFT